jgi:NTP pyrophosphatase (non-canonical NTP hydrolase)
MSTSMAAHNLSALAMEIHGIAVEKGFWEGERNFGEAIALIHSELSEALEAARIGNPEDKNCVGFGQVEIELADAVIRILDLAFGLNFNIGLAVGAKMAFNRDRPHKHGKAF